jgi:hypothetical protein
MELNRNTHVMLTIRERAKGLPYFGHPNPDGTGNHGFQLLKGTGRSASEIFEAANEPALLVFHQP